MPTFPPSRPSPDCLTHQRSRRVGYETGVKAHHSNFQFRGELHAPVEALGEHVPHQAPLRVVGKAKDFVFAVERCDRSHRAEDLCTRQLGVQGHVHQHGGRVEVAGSFRACASGQDTCALADGVGHAAFDLSQALPLDEGSDAGTGQCAYRRRCGQLLRRTSGACRRHRLPLHGLLRGAHPTLQS